GAGRGGPAAGAAAGARCRGDPGAPAGDDPRPADGAVRAAPAGRGALGGAGGAAGAGDQLPAIRLSPRTIMVAATSPSRTRQAEGRARKRLSSRAPKPSAANQQTLASTAPRSAEHTSELQSRE